MRSRDTIIAGSVLLSCLCVIAVADRAPKIERVALAQAHTAVNDPGVRIRADGRDITLSGSATSKEAKDALGARVLALASVRKVHNRLFVNAQQENLRDSSNKSISYDYALSVNDVNDRVEVFGNVPNDLSRQRLMTIIYTASIGKTVDADRLRVAGVESPRSEAWDQAARSALQSAVVLSGLKFYFDDASLMVRGQAEDEAHRAAVLNDLNTTSNRTKIQVSIAKSQVDLCQEQVDDLLTSRPIEFNAQQASLTQDSQHLLTEIRDVLWQCPTTRVVIRETGDVQTHFAAGIDRRQVVADYLIQTGVVASRMVAVSGNSSEPGGSAMSSQSAKGQEATLLILLEGDHP